MKKIRRIFLGALAAAFILAVSVFFAACGSEKYTLTFMDGETQIAAITDVEGASVQAPDAPEKTGYEFSGWYLTSDFAGSAATVPSTMPSENVTYYAKYDALEKITLDLDGGSLSTTTLYLRAGANLYDAVKDYAPTKTGLTFGGWFLESEQLSEDYLVPSSGVTLTAKYKASYTVEIYLQSLEDETGYVKDDTLTQTGSAWVGSYTPIVSVVGFEKIYHEDAVETQTLSAGENVYKFYFDRLSYKFSYDANVPAGATVSGTMDDVTVDYGATVKVTANGYSVTGYRFLGWATTPSGEVAYTEGDDYVVKNTAPLYAVWDKGYADRNGGTDFIFLADDGVAILLRGPVEIKGTYTVTDGVTSFEFVSASGNVLKGTLASDYTFSYYAQALNKTYKLYDSAGNVDGNVTLTLDGMLAATYTAVSDDGTVTYKGTFASAEDEGVYIFEADDGEHGFYFMVYATGEGEDAEYLFRIRGLEASLGELYNFKFSSADTYIGSVSSSFTVTLNGFGAATVKASGKTAKYSYKLIDEEESIFSLFDGNGDEVYRIKVISLTSMYGFINYDFDHAGEYVDESGNKLALDGFNYSAVYTPNGGEPVECKYVATASILGGYIVTFGRTDGNGNVSGLASYKAEKTESGNVISRLAEGYGEYVYFADSSYSYCPVLVLDGNGGAKLYDYDSETGEATLLASGTYSYDSATERYTYQQTQAEDLGTDSDYVLFTKLVFTLDTENWTMDIYEWIEATYGTGDDENTVKYFKTYTTEGGTQTLLIKGDSGIYIYTDENGVEFTCQVIGEGDSPIAYVYVYAFASGYDTNIFYFHIDEENNSFTILDLAPCTSTLIYDTVGTTLTLDGMGNAVYAISSTGVSEEGTYAFSGEYTFDGAEIYTFYDADGAAAFDFILLSQSSSAGVQYLFSIFDEDWNGKLFGRDNSELVIDGFLFSASYTDADGNVYEGQYRFYSETVIILTAYADDDSVNTYYFDLNTADHTYTVRDGLNGGYLSVSNGAADFNYAVSLDGYGNVALYDYSVSEKPVGTGTYKIIDSEKSVVEMTFEFVEDYVAVIPETFRVTLGSNGVYNLYYSFDELDNAYVSADLEVLVLDGVGNAAYIGADGVRYDESYTVVQAADGTEVVVFGGYVAFVLDTEKGSFELYAVAKTKYGDMYYLLRGYGEPALTLWTMADGSTTLSLDLSSSYAVYNGDIDSLNDPYGFGVAINFAPYVQFKVGSDIHFEYTYDYGDFHYDGHVTVSSVYGIYFITDNVYDVCVPVEYESGDYTVVAYIVVSGDAPAIYDVLLYDKDGNLIGDDYYGNYYITQYYNGSALGYYNYLKFADDGTIYYLTFDGNGIVDTVYAITPTSETEIEVTVKDILFADDTQNNAIKVAYVTDSNGDATVLYVTKDGKKITSGDTTLALGDGCYYVSAYYTEETEQEGEDGETETVTTRVNLNLVLDLSGETAAVYVCDYDYVTYTAEDGETFRVKALYNDEAKKVFHIDVFEIKIGDVWYDFTDNVVSCEKNESGAYVIGTEAATYTVTIGWNDSGEITITALTVEKGEKTATYQSDDINAEVVYTVGEDGVVDGIVSVTIDEKQITVSELTEVTYNEDGSFSFVPPASTTYAKVLVDGDEVVVLVKAQTDSTDPAVSVEYLADPDGIIYEIVSVTYNEASLTVYDFRYVSETEIQIIAYATAEDGTNTYYAVVLTAASGENAGDTAYTISVVSLKQVTATSDYWNVVWLEDDDGKIYAVLSAVYTNSAYGVSYDFDVLDFNTTADGDLLVVIDKGDAKIYALIVSESAEGEYSFSLYYYTYVMSWYFVSSTSLYPGAHYLLGIVYMTDSTTGELTVVMIDKFYVYDSTAQTYLKTEFTATLNGSTFIVEVGDDAYYVNFHQLNGVIAAVVNKFNMVSSSNSVLVYLTDETGNLYAIGGMYYMGQYQYQMTLSNRYVLDTKTYWLVYTFNNSTLNYYFELTDEGGRLVYCMMTGTSSTDDKFAFNFLLGYDGSNYYVLDIVGFFQYDETSQDYVSIASSITSLVKNADNDFTFGYNGKVYHVVFTFTYDENGELAGIVATVTEVASDDTSGNETTEDAEGSENTTESTDAVPAD